MYAAKNMLWPYCLWPYAVNRHLQTYFNMIDKILSEFDGKTFNCRFILIQEGSVEKKKEHFVKWH